MKRLTGGFVTALVILCTLLVLRWYWRSQGAADAKLNATDAAHVAHLDSLERAVQVHRRREDSLRVRVAVAETASTRAQRTRVRLIVRVDTLRLGADTAALVVMLDSVTAALLDENRHLTEQVTIWRTLYVSADSGRTLLHHALHESEALRASWQRAAQRPHYTLTDLGGGVMAGYGLAEKCASCLLAGAGVVLVPRLVHAVGRLF